MYRAEAVIPMEIQANSFSVEHSVLSEDLDIMRFNIDQAEYRKENAFIKMVVHRYKMSQLFNSKVKLQSFNIGNLVLMRSNVFGGNVRPGKLDEN